MNKILVKTVGFIGDIIFASSVAKKLVQQHQCKVDFYIRIPQPLELLYNNPWINEVFLEEPSSEDYVSIYNLEPINRETTPCEQFQKQCGIKYCTPEYKVYTNKGLDLWAKNLVNYKPKKTIAVMQNWEERSFLFTEEEYKKGIDVPPYGYGGKRRNIDSILKEIYDKDPNLVLVPVGKPNGYTVNNTDLNSVSEYSLTASIIKNCDFFIGAEGGLANLAAGVGTRTIITGDFIHQLYGWNGVIEKCKEPKLGPKYYFEGNKHITLDPYLDDIQVAHKIIEIINN